MTCCIISTVIYVHVMHVIHFLFIEQPALIREGIAVDKYINQHLYHLTATLQGSKLVLLGLRFTSSFEHHQN